MFHQRMVVLTLAVVFLSYTAAKPTFDTTEDSLVISVGPNNEATTDSSTTDEPNAPIKLTEMDVLSTISLRYAHTAVVTRVRNPARFAQESTFRMLLPDTAFISGFTMTVDGKPYKAFVKKKEEAKQIYSEAVSRGYGAAHIAAKARDSNHFTVSMNVEPKSNVVFNLTYEELLVRRNGVYNHAINLHPGALVPKMQVTVHIKEAGKISTVRVPEIRTGNEIDADENAPQNGKVIISRTEDNREAIITFTPDADEQKRLIRVYAEKSESRGPQEEGLLGQFVVQYDVDRSSSGEILVNDGYFVHFFAPTSLSPLPKHVVFVLDTSISMIGRKIAQLRDAMKTILNSLNEGDHFSIVQFNTVVQVVDWSQGNGRWQPSNAYSNSRSITLEATPENIAKAQIIISNLEASRATNIAGALDAAVDIAHEVAEYNSNVENAEAENNKLESIIIFLTDGQPTAGVTSPNAIINNVNMKNTGQNKASIFSLAFGNDPDRKFLRKLSLSNSGFMRHIYMAGDAALQLQDFYRTVASPLLADVQFKYPKDQIKEDSLTKNEFPAYYAGSETVVAGRVVDGTVEFTPQVIAISRASDFPGRRRFEDTLNVPVVHRESYLPLERIWAYLTIKQLLDQKDGLLENDENKNKAQDLEKRALDIALQYEFVTPLTSLVVVKPNDTRAVEVKPADDDIRLYDRFGSRSAGSRSPRLRLASLPSSHGGFTSPSNYDLSWRSGSRVAPLMPASYMPGSSSFSSYPSRPSAPHSSVFSDIFGYPVMANLRPTSKSYVINLSGSSDQIGYRAMARPRTINVKTITIRPILFNPISPTTTAAPSTTTAESFTTTAVPSTTTAESSTKTAKLNATDDPLEPYSLKEFAWTLSLLDAANDSLKLHVNGTIINLKLTKDIGAAPADGAACGVAGGAARCRYLPRCGAARALSARRYQTAYCVLENGYAGVCCPMSNEEVQFSISIEA